MQTLLDISRVLTPAQRQKIAQRMTQRRVMMERHRGERETLERATPR
jgi:periplasmic protein CpxP/Spy